MSKKFCHFPDLSKRVTTSTENELKGNKVKELTDKFQDRLDSFQAKFEDLPVLKPYSVFLERYLSCCRNQ